MNIVILGSSLFAKELAKELSDSEHKVFVVIKDKDVALEMSSENAGIVVVNSDPSKQAVLDELELENCDVLIAATEKEEVNTLACLYAKSKGVKKLYAKTTNPNTYELLNAIEIKALNPEVTAVHDITLHLNKPLVAELVEPHTGDYNIMQSPVSNFKNLVGKKLGPLQGDFFVILSFHVDNDFIFGADKEVKEDSTLIIMYRKEKEKELTKALKSL